MAEPWTGSAAWEAHGRTLPQGNVEACTNLDFGGSPYQTVKERSGTGYVSRPGRLEVAGWSYGCQ
jgi:hypothetical protein